MSKNILSLVNFIEKYPKNHCLLENNIQNSIINNILVAKPNALYVNIHLNWVVFYIVGILVYIQTLNLIKF